MKNLENKEKIGIVLIGILLILGIVFYMLFSNNSEEEITIEETISEKTEEETEENNIMIHIMGQVNKPGVITLSEGARMIDAIEAAGGLTEQADIEKINLVYVLEDGLKIKIPTIEEPMYITSENGENVIIDDEEGKGENVVININKAGIEELTQLPGIGEAMAQRIIDYRKENGNFESIEDIKNVSGIGEAKFDNIKENICIK